MIISILISIGLDVIHTYVNFYSNSSEYESENKTIGYISNNLISKPIKK